MLELSLSDGVKWDVKQRSQYTAQKPFGSFRPPQKSRKAGGSPTKKKFLLPQRPPLTLGQ